MKTLILLSLLTLAACGEITPEEQTRMNNHNHSKICLEGVVYWSGVRALSVKMLPNGKPELCTK